jgi:hypothetical protein
MGKKEKGLKIPKLKECFFLSKKLFIQIQENERIFRVSLPSSQLSSFSFYYMWFCLPCLGKSDSIPKFSLAKKTFWFFVLLNFAFSSFLLPSFFHVLSKEIYV